MVRYAQKREKSGFVNNMTTVLPASGSAGLRAETFSGSPELFFDSLARPKRSKWQHRRIIPAGLPPTVLVHFGETAESP